MPCMNTTNHVMWVYTTCSLHIVYIQMSHLTKGSAVPDWRVVLQFVIEMPLQSACEYNAAIYESHDMAVCSLQQYSILTDRHMLS